MNTALRISLAANIALVGVVSALVWHAIRAPHGSPPGPTDTGDVHRSASPARGSGIEAATASVRPATALELLQQAGVSREVAIEALLAEFHRRWDERFADLEDRHAPGAVPEREYIELGRLRDAAQVRELLALMGETGYRVWDRERALRAANPGNVPLTPEESDAVSQLQRDFEEQHRELQMAMEDGIADMADAAVMQRQAQAARDRALETLLGSERLAAMRGISDPVTEVYRRFGDLSPTPAQARAVLEADADHHAQQASLEARLKTTPNRTGSIAEELAALDQAREESLRRIFGPEAYESTRRRSDPTYRTLKQYAAAWELQEAEVENVYATLRPFLVQTGHTRLAAGLSEAAGNPVNWHEVNAAIDAVRSETELTLEKVIGARRLARLRENGVLNGR